MGFDLRIQKAAVAFWSPFSSFSHLFSVHSESDVLGSLFMEHLPSPGVLGGSSPASLASTPCP